MRKAIVESQKGLLLRIQAIPSSQKAKLGYEPWTRRLKVWVKSEAQEGKANKEIEAFFSKLFDCQTTIVSGSTTRKKTVLIAEKTKDEILKKLEESIFKGKRP
ncbi:MAG: DUF167 family protein [Candidatus Altiarchaeota archaeon]